MTDAEDYEDFDVSDWIKEPASAAGRQNGHRENMDDGVPGRLYFQDAEFRAKRQIYTAQELEDLQLPPITWIVEGLIPMGLTFLGARLKVGKTLLCTALAKAVATGEDFLGFRVTQGRVLYLQFEDAAELTKRRNRKLEMQGTANVDFALNFGSLADPRNMKILGDMLVSGCYRLVILDTWERAHIGADTADRLWIMDQVDKMQRTARSHRMSILLIDHLNKSHEKYGDIFDAIAESSTKIAAADTLMALFMKADKHYLKVRSRYAMEVTYALRRAPGSVLWEIVDDLTPAARKIYAWMQANDLESTTAALIQEQLGIAPSTIYHALERLTKHTFLIKEGLQWRLPDGIEANLDTASSSEVFDSIQW